MEPSSPCFEVMTSIRSDAILKLAPFNPRLCSGETPSQFYMMPYHYDRIVAAATDFRWSKAARIFTSEIGILGLESALEQHLHDMYDRVDYPSPLKVKSRLSLSSPSETDCVPRDPRIA